MEICGNWLIDNIALANAPVYSMINKTFGVVFSIRQATSILFYKFGMPFTGNGLRAGVIKHFPLD